MYSEYNPSTFTFKITDTDFTGVATIRPCRPRPTMLDKKMTFSIVPKYNKNRRGWGWGMDFI